MLLAVIQLLAAFIYWSIFWWDSKRPEAIAQQNQPTSLSDSDHAARITLIVPIGPSDNRDEAIATIQALRQQQYQGYCEVVVADFTHDNDDIPLQALIENLANTTEGLRLRHTAVPTSSRQIVPRKLALTLGFKAAWGEWVMVVRPGAIPPDTHWVEACAAHMTSGYDYIQYYTTYRPCDTSSPLPPDTPKSDRVNLRKKPIYSPSATLTFEHIHHYLDVWYAWQKGIRFNPPLEGYALRKEWFLAERGFSDSLAFNFGEETILIARHALPSRTAMVLSPSSTLHLRAPSTTELYFERIVRSESHQYTDVEAAPLTATRRATVVIAVYAYMAAFITWLLTRLAQVGYYLLPPDYDNEVLSWLAPVFSLDYRPIFDSLIDALCILILFIFAGLTRKGLRRIAGSLGESLPGSFSFLAFVLSAPYRWLRISFGRTYHSPDFDRKAYPHSATP